MLGDHKQKLMLKINGLDKQTKLIRKEKEDKSNKINIDCQNLSNSSPQRKKMLRGLEERIDLMKNTMGMYSGKEKHKVGIILLYGQHLSVPGTSQSSGDRSQL